jgi:superfamily I DNA/RNA helicase
MKYVYLTLDALESFASIRQFQSAEFNETSMLCEVLKGDIHKWKHPQIKIYPNQDKTGVVFYTNKIDRNKGILFDYDNFKSFIEENCGRIITIFQKTIKYSIRYFNNMPLAPCEKNIPNLNISMVYPFPFSATKEAYKILIDKNTSKYNREERNILTVYYSGTAEYRKSISFTNLNKAMSLLKGIIISSIEEQNNEHTVTTLNEVDLEKIDLTIDSKIGIDNWTPYLTQKQKKFVDKEITGPERLTGAAGTGKTLTMILRCINLLKKKKNDDYKIVFITHSLSAKNHIIQIFKNNYPDVEKLLCQDGNFDGKLLVTTLQEWCIKYLGAYIAETEYLDKDARDSKILQIMYIEDAYSKVKDNDFETYKRICSEKFVTFMEKTNQDTLLEMLQYEIAVIIKGRAEGDIEKYKELNRLVYSIPCQKDADFEYLYLVYRKYQEALEKVNQYDSDDIILTALGQLNTPIWKRRRNREGFDVCFIDETHLFNINELSIFHYLNKEISKNHIVFAIDKSQAIGERGILDESMLDILVDTKSTELINDNFCTVFRSSPDIINLAFNILSSGVTLFKNFENPLDYSSVNFTKEEENKCVPLKYVFYESDEIMIEQAFYEAEKYAREHNVSKSKILLATTTDLLFVELERYANQHHKPCEIIKSRGDAGIVSVANNSQKFVLGGIDYIGGLEFDAVIIIGIDNDRVPPKNNDEIKDSFHFMNYAWHNRMYVAVTRAKYTLRLMGNKTRGISPILESAVNLEIIAAENI